jgi:hypothetical protein
MPFGVRYDEFIIPTAEIVAPKFRGLASQVSDGRASRSKLRIMAIERPLGIGLCAARSQGNPDN